MNTKQTEALKLALEALEIEESQTAYHGRWLTTAITAIREALTEQPAQQEKPYGWKVYGVNSLLVGEFAEVDAKAEAKRIGGTCIAFPLYTSPQPSKPWVGLTDGEELKLAQDSMGKSRHWLVAEVADKLWEKNA